MPHIPATTSQAVAVYLTIELLVRAFQLPVVVVISLSLVPRGCYLILDFFTDRHTLIALLLTTACTMYARTFLQRIAPSPKDAQEGLARVKVILPILAFVPVCLFCHFILNPLGRLTGMEWILTWSPRMSWSFMCRAILFCLAMGLSVLARYIGPPSVMRCSSCPLLEHPLQTSLRKLLSQWTVDNVLSLLTAPTDNARLVLLPGGGGGGLGTAWEYRGRARRFQTPMLVSTIAQVILTSICSLVAAYTFVLPIFHPIFHSKDDDSSTGLPLLFQNNTLVLTSLIASLWHLTQTALTYPELNPIYLRGRGGGAPFHMRSPFSTTSVDRLMVLSILVVGIAFVAATTTTTSPSTAHHSINGDEEPRFFSSQTAAWCSLLVSSLAVGSGIYMYLDLFDQFIQYMICNFGKDLHQVVSEVMDDRSHDALLRVAVESLAHSDPTLAQSLLVPSTRAYADLERHEVQRYQQACQAMGQRLLQSESPQHERPAPLEEDVLRIVILAHYGAGRNLQDAASLTTKHIEQWINPSPDYATGGEPLVVPLVRAISVYIGGLGESLLTCTQKMQAIDSDKTESHSRMPPYFPWVLAPGTIACASYSVRAGARFLLTNGQASRPVGRLTMLLPVFLSALHHLEIAMLQWAGQTRVLGVTSSHRTAREVFQRECPQLWPVYLAISEASTALLAALPPRAGAMHRHLSPDCSRWVEELLYSMTPPVVVPPTIGPFQLR